MLFKSYKNKSQKIHMEDLTLEHHSIHHIDLINESLTKPTTPAEDSDIEAFGKDVLKGVFTSSRGKAFEFASDTEEVAMLVRGMMNGGWPVSSVKIANRLLRSEINSQEGLGNFQNVSKGALMQMKVSSGESQFIIFTKVDHGKFMDEKDSKIHFGLPFEKRVQKTCVFEFDGGDTPISIRIFDSNKKIAKYWWRDFLCCIGLISSEDNTKKAFNEVDKILTRNLKKQSKPDYTYLRNNIITYFRSNDAIAFDDFIENIVRSYAPINDNININEIADKIAALPEKKGFDTQFEVDKKSINARIKRVVVLAENFELNIKGEIKDLERLVNTGIDDEGKFLKIYSDEGFSEFNRIKNNGQ